MALDLGLSVYDCPIGSMVPDGGVRQKSLALSQTAVDGRTTRHAGYQLRQKKRK
jgi:hypothetical protein